MLCCACCACCCAVAAAARCTDPARPYPGTLCCAVHATHAAGLRITCRACGCPKLLQVAPARRPSTKHCSMVCTCPMLLGLPAPSLALLASGQHAPPSHLTLPMHLFILSEAVGRRRRRRRRGPGSTRPWRGSPRQARQAQVRLRRLRLAWCAVGVPLRGAWCR